MTEHRPRPGGDCARMVMTYDCEGCGTHVHLDEGNVALVVEALRAYVAIPDPPSIIDIPQDRRRDLMVARTLAEDALCRLDRGPTGNVADVSVN